MKNGLTFASECRCGFFENERLKSRLKFANIPEEFEGQSVCNFRTDVYEDVDLAEMIKTIAENYVKKFDKMQEIGKGLYFFSETKGSGKTRLAVSIVNDIVKNSNINGKFCSTLQILDKIKAAWGGQEQEFTIINDIINAPLLIIDDIGAEMQRDWINEKFYSILNGRMLSKKVTIFTSNCCIENLKLDDRIINRIEKMAVPVEFPEESIRKKIAKKENDIIFDELIGLND